jgi:Fe-S-cluster containining protein
MLDSLIPSEVCLSCRGCCRFAERGSVWSPLFLYEEIEKLVADDLVPACLFSHSGASLKKASRIDGVEIDDQLYCSCLDTRSNACKIYSHRPLDCRLYPFLLLKKDGKVFLALDVKCPFAADPRQAPTLSSWQNEVMRFVSTPEFKKTVRRNPEILQAYPGDFKILAPLSFD